MPIQHFGGQASHDHDHEGATLQTPKNLKGDSRMKAWAHNEILNQADSDTASQISLAN